MVMSQTGRNDSGMDPFGPNRNEFLVEPLPYSKWPPGKTKRDLVDELAQRLNSHIPGASFNITQPIIDTSTEIATGSSADLAVIISGPDSDGPPSPGGASRSTSSSRSRARLTRRSSRKPISRSFGSPSIAPSWHDTA